MFFLDVDRFKTVNDVIGHAAGDAILAQLAARLRHAIRPGDTIGRFGGDEFVGSAKTCMSPKPRQSPNGYAAQSKTPSP